VAGHFAKRTIKAAPIWAAKDKSAFAVVYVRRVIAVHNRTERGGERVAVDDLSFVVPAGAAMLPGRRGV
jgi:hypothetical protein